MASALALTAVVMTVGAARATQAADDAEAELAGAASATAQAEAGLERVKADTVAAREEAAALEGLFAPGMAATLQAAHLVVTSEVCASDEPQAAETLSAAVGVAEQQVPELADHPGWEAAVDLEVVAEGCDDG